MTESNIYSECPREIKKIEIHYKKSLPENAMKEIFHIDRDGSSIVRLSDRKERNCYSLKSACNRYDVDQHAPAGRLSLAGKARVAKQRGYNMCAECTLTCTEVTSLYVIWPGPT